MKFILVPLGSAGDVFPFVGLAEALQQRGHAVLVLINEYFAGTVARAHVPFRVISSADDYLRVAHDPRAWHPLHGPRTVLSYAHLLIQPVYDAIRAAGEPDQATVASSALGWGARLAQERDGYQLVTVDLQPAVLFSAIDPPCLPLMSRRAPAWCNRFIFRTAERLLLDPVCCPPINAWRRQHGMPDLHGITAWWHSPSCILGMFPAWFAPPPADWPAQLQLTQFPLWDEGGNSALPDEIERFLDAGEPPIVVTPGSANACPRSFWDTVVAASQKLGRRALLLARFSDQIPQPLPANVQHFSYASFAQLLPRAAAVVHHGGIGTTARALAAGIPQVIRPFSHDQPDNARRVRRLGVGGTIHSYQFTANRLARELDRLLCDPNVITRCQAAAARIQDVDPFDEACQVLVTFGQ